MECALGLIGKPCSCVQFIKMHIIYYKSHENLISTASHVKTRISNTSYMRTCIRSAVMCTVSEWGNQIRGSYDKTIITVVTLVCVAVGIITHVAHS